jgi:hypothetical protein
MDAESGGVLARAIGVADARYQFFAAAVSGTLEIKRRAVWGLT